MINIIKTYSIAFLFILAITCFSEKSHAQLFAKNPGYRGNTESAWRLGIGVEPGIPLGSNINHFSDFALGGSLRLQYDHKGPVAVTLTGGYTNFFAKQYQVGTVSVNPKNYGIIPVKAGLKYFLKQRFYISGETGAGFETSGSYKSTKFIFSPGIGIASNKTGIDAGLRYEHYSGGTSDDFGLVALRLAYGFKL